jgi:acylglycerol lipase
MASFAKQDDGNYNDDSAPLLPEADGKIFTNMWSKDCKPACGSFVNKQNLRLATFYYPAKKGKKCKGTILAIHGYGAHTHWEFMSYPYNKFKNSWVSNFNNNGYNVLSFDLQSHGLSQNLIPGVRCYCDKFSDFVDDSLQIYYQHKKNSKKNEKIYVLGVSMGGNIAAHVAVRLGSELDGLILGCPMLSVEKVKKQCKNAILLPISGCVSKCWPTLAVGSKAKNTMYPEIGKHHDEDPLNYVGMVRARMAVEMIDACDLIQAISHKIVTPTFIVHSSKDTFTDPEGSLKFYSKIESEIKEINLLEDDDFWHGLTKEPNNVKVANLMIDFLNNL